MKTRRLHPALIAIGLSLTPPLAIAENSVSSALSGGSTKVDVRLRYESVSQSNAAKDATALTVRTRLTYSTAAYAGFSAVVEAEDVRTVAGIDDYTVGPTGFNPGEYSVIADPESTEIDQGYLQYKTGKVTTKLGRQVIIMDNHRFVGHVGWRQDRQTFDGASVSYMPSDKFTFSYAYLDERNRIFADQADIDSKDHLINLSYMTDYGKLTVYSYLLENEGSTVDNGLDTSGLRFTGSTMLEGTKVLYALEYADQSSDSGPTSNDATYQMAEVGAVVKGFTVKAGQEVLGSDKGNYGFSTPLATLHKFNGWADQFLGTPAQGLVDSYLTVGTKVGKGKLTLVYHDYEADEASATVDDMGDEWNAVYARKFGKHYSAGVKYASYDAGDIKVDAKKLWVWLGLAF